MCNLYANTMPAAAMLALFDVDVGSDRRGGRGWRALAETLPLGVRDAPGIEDDRQADPAQGHQ